ncbi:DUF4262 domain-containing protein [Chitinophaga silvatica]|uniref:DUF4262 domain-containing protein n=1 Tax=Chitinophaga silvatica TaxID=2282649 RepID=A0A3E1Y836_9BACT|nr:DUF4262 domain-containing protein [Chitinophaga silvatica]RFS21335.1 DUF4262 domain-containing protein [Chitinophaga silvatica]
MNQDSKDCNHTPISSKEIQRKIDKYGCFIVLIEADDYLPAFAYTIGLYQKFNHPELIAFGLSTDQLGDLLNIGCAKITNGSSLTPGILYDNFIQNYKVQFLEVHKTYYSDYMGVTNLFYDTENYPSLQLVWPDKQSRFPWEIGFNPDWKFKQPLLDRNIDFKFYEERNLGVFTTKQVLEGKPILYVYHNEDGDWQFHSEEDPDLDDAKLVAFEQITLIDPSVNQLYHLTYNRSATRNSPNDPWIWEED